MKLLFDILLFCLCMAIVIQDLKSRLISVAFLLCILALLLTRFIMYSDPVSNIPVLFSNYLFICAQLVFLYFYFTRIRRMDLAFFDRLMGWGDVLMALCMALAFPLPQLLVYLLVSYACGIIFAVFVPGKKAEVSIPLAGMMALVYVTNILAFYCLGFHLIQPFNA